MGKGSCCKRATWVPYFNVTDISTVVLDTYDGNYIGFGEFETSEEFLDVGFLVPVNAKIKSISAFAGSGDPGNVVGATGNIKLTLQVYRNGTGLLNVGSVIISEGIFTTNADFDCDILKNDILLFLYNWRSDLF